jgi:uncharacterized protein (TIGR03067 family)
MILLARVVCLGLCALLAVGCGRPSTNSGRIRSEAERQAAEEAAINQRFEGLIGTGKEALQARRFEEAVKDFEEAARLQAGPRAWEHLRQAHRARLEGLWVLSRQEGRDGTFTVEGLATGLLFEGDKVTGVHAMKGVIVGKGASGSYQFDVSSNPKTIDLRWSGKEAGTERGIYELEKETLTLSCAEPGEKERPRGFDSDKADIKRYARADQAK